MKEELQDRLNATIVDKVLSLDVVENECELFRIEDSNGTTFKQAVAIVDDEISVVFSLPQNGRKNIYMLASDGSTDLLRNILANIEESESDRSILLGNVLLLESEELKNRDISGVLFLPIDTSPVLEDLPSNFYFEGTEYCFFLVTFLSFVEHDVWRTRGHDALMDFFAETEKDLIAF